MDFGTAVANVAKKLGNRTDLDASIQSEMQLAQVELEAARTLPWFLLAEELYAELPAMGVSVTVPDDFLREYEEGAMWMEDTSVSPSTYTLLTKVPLDTLRAVTASGEADEVPAYYALAGTSFYFAPPAPTAKRLRIMCYRRAVALSASTDTNVWLTYTPEILISKTGMRMAQYLRSTELFSMFQGQYAEAAQALEQSAVARAMENFEASMGGG